MLNLGGVRIGSTSLGVVNLIKKNSAFTTPSSHEFDDFKLYEEDLIWKLENNSMVL